MTGRYEDTTKDTMVSDGNADTGESSGATQGMGAGTDASAVTDAEAGTDHPKGSRVPVVIGVIVTACMVITATFFGLRWTARHGGGTGDPAEASSQVDNTPIPMPHAEEISVASMSFPTETAIHVMSGELEWAWDGHAETGTLPVVIASRSADTMVVSLPTTGVTDISASFESRAEHPFLSFSASMVTRDQGSLMMTTSIANLPRKGTANIFPLSCRVGLTDEDEERDDLPMISTTVSYTVGEENIDYVGSYASGTASLTMGSETKTAYLVANTRKVAVTVPNGSWNGETLQAGRVTIRQNGMQDSLMGTVVPSGDDPRLSWTYEEIAAADIAHKGMH